ncbi:MAG TPA: helix-turn-helix transcriptional regulator [Solirubrobacteraceae bacterium]|nr:helix-turn-helix transcriptional regulator [Solirubrobacteraceae bacterium]
MSSQGLVDHVTLGRRLRAVREAAKVSQDEARNAIGVSQPTYSRIETGERPLKGDELVTLADLFGVRAAAITGVAKLQERARYAARTDGSQPQMALMREKLQAYLELDSYLTDQGVDLA